MSNSLNELAIKVGFEVVNVDDGCTNYEYNERVSGVESISYIIKVIDKPTKSEQVLTFEAIVNVLPKKLKKKVKKLTKHSDMSDEKNIELVIFAVDEFKAKSDYSKLKEYGLLLGKDIEKMGYNFKYFLTKKEYSDIISKIEQALPMEYAPVLGNIKNIDYKIGYIKNNKDIVDKREI